MSLTHQVERRVLILQPTNAEVSTNQIYAAKYEWVANGELSVPTATVFDSLKHTDAAFTIYRVDVSVETGGTSQYRIIVKSYDTAGLNTVTHVDDYVSLTGDRNRVSVNVADGAVDENRSLEFTLTESTIGTPAYDMTVTLIAEDFADLQPEREGHRILDEDDTVMAYRPDLQFNNLLVEDDGGNNRTVVTGREIQDEAGSPLTTRAALQFTASGDGLEVSVTDDSLNNRTVVEYQFTPWSIALISEVQTSGTDGGTATSGAFFTRTLNTLSDPNSIITSLAANQFTIAAGTYYFEALAPANEVGRHKAKIRNITDSTDTLIGVSSGSTTATSVDAPARVEGFVVIASPKTFELQQIVEVTNASTGRGVAGSFGVDEVYSTIKITKLK